MQEKKKKTLEIDKTLKRNKWMKTNFGQLDWTIRQKWHKREIDNITKFATFGECVWNEIHSL